MLTHETVSMITLSPPSLSLDSWYTLPSYPSSQYSIHLHLITPLCSFLSQCLWSCRLQMSRLGWVTRQYQGSLNKCGPLIITDCSIVSLVSDLWWDGVTSVPRALSSNDININNPVSILGSSILQLINGETEIQNAAEILPEPQESNVWMCDAEVKRWSWSRSLGMRAEHGSWRGDLSVFAQCRI